MKINTILSCVFVVLFCSLINAQNLTRAEVNKVIKDLPAFSIHKDNFFMTGIPTNKSVNSATADVKYQVSFKQLITRNTLPWETYLFLTYSQKAFWDIYQKSKPFEEINFNPSLGLGKPIYDKADRIKGLATFSLNHTSNGRDSIYSRSWNNLSLGYATFLGQKTLLNVKAWVPFRYQEDNPDLLEYIGLGEINLSHEFIEDRLIAEIMLQKGITWEWKGKIRSRIYYSPFKTLNQYFMLEWFVGYAESLIDYTEFKSMVRLGYVIKTNELDLLKRKN